ncbi:MAG TPA: transposase zinc-binding domain-containing protein [Acetobacteraceae bacterium]|nr:transposase zinc-binding domain-containing protein [Acetobacteraceae bacterium]
MRRSGLEVADIFHRHGADWRKANAGHLSLGQLQVMSAIESCRSAVLGGHVERCEDCGHVPPDHHPPCPCCGGRMMIVEVFGRGGAPRGPPAAASGI